MGLTAPRKLWLVPVLGVVLAIGWLSWVHHWGQLCHSREWPAKWLCDKPEASAKVRQQELMQVVGRNPGDTVSWVQLARVSAELGADSALPPAAVLNLATHLSPQDPVVQGLQAMQALAQKQPEQAVPWLIRLLRDNQNRSAAAVLAGLMAQPKAVAAMMPWLEPDPSWLEPTLQAMREVKVPVALAMPLVAKALENRSLSPQLAQQAIQELKNGGFWLEAHGVWRSWLGRSVPLVFNGDFEAAWMDAGFDWEITPVPVSKAGAVVEQVEEPGRGGVMRVEFNGRPMPVALVRQHLVLLSDHYRLRGEYAAPRLQSREGVVWALVCASGGQDIVSSPAMKAGSGWQKFELEFRLPPKCGHGVTLQLQMALLSESLTGVRGEIRLDNLKLESLP
ncbi:MAG: hypothetical protein RL758_2391 [Pseudomonadota bacterium]|jgi:hypothetical protein